jgi:ribonuclease BN (tRNA processing enzyme)
MRIRVLGCYGSEYPGYRTTSILINGSLALDAGSMTSCLRLSEQADIRHILISHAHLDHLLDVGFLADNIIGRIAQPVEIVGTSHVIGNLMRYVLNNRIWPDFTRIPTPQSPVLKVRKVRQRAPFNLEGLIIKAIPVNHTVPSWGFLIHEPGVGTILYSGDTGPTREIWNAARRVRDLRAVFIEASFPNRLQKLADRSGHLTPQTMVKELEKINISKQVRIFLYHMKPLHLKEIQKDVYALRMKNVSILEAGRKITL